MNETIHISDFPEDKIYILLNEKYRKNLIEKARHKLECKNYFELSLIINRKFKTRFNGGDIKYWLEGKKIDIRTGIKHPKFMPLWLVLFLVNLVKDDLAILDKKVVAYRSGGRGFIVNLPILPIIVTPEFESIVIHLFGDGYAGDFTPSYFQKNKIAVDNFIKKLKNCFGNFERSVYLINDMCYVRFPKAMTDVLSNFYNIHSYMSYKSKVPIKIINRKDNNFKLACLVAYIVDEGNIRDVISLYSVNLNLISGMRKLALDCGYKCSKLQFNKKANSYIFTISIKNIEKIYYDICNLSKLFPTCNLSFKEKSIKFILNRRTINNPRDRKITQEVVIRALKERSSSAQQISRLSNYAYCTIIHTLKDLYNEGKVKRTKSKSKTFFWNLIDSEKK